MKCPRCKTTMRSLDGGPMASPIYVCDNDRCPMNDAIDPTV